MKKLLATLSTILILSLPTLAGDGYKHSDDKTIVSVATQAGSFNTLLQAAEAAGLVETLTGQGPYTVFAPTDDAFAELPEGALESLLADKAKLKAVLLYHVVPGNVSASDVVGMTKLTSAQGEDIAVVVKGQTVTVDGAKIIQTDIDAGNGVIHVIDTVMMP